MRLVSVLILVIGVFTFSAIYFIFFEENPRHEVIAPSIMSGHETNEKLSFIEKILPFNNSNITGFKQTDDSGRTYIKGSLPPKLQKAKTLADEYVEEIRYKKQQIQPNLISDQKAEERIARVNSIIAATNARLGVITPRLNIKNISQIPTTDPEIQKVKDKLQTLSDKIEEVERKF